MAADVITALRVRATNTPRGDFFFLEIEVYSKNLYPRIPWWCVSGCGTYEQVVRAAAQIASVCEGGMLQMRGRKDAKPENLMASFWNAMRAAVSCGTTAIVPIGRIERWWNDDEKNAAAVGRVRAFMAERGLHAEGKRFNLDLSDERQAGALLTLLDKGDVRIVEPLDMLHNSQPAPFAFSKTLPGMRKGRALSMAEIHPGAFPWRVFGPGVRNWQYEGMVVADGESQSRYSVIEHWYKTIGADMEVAQPGSSFINAKRLRALYDNAPLADNAVRWEVQVDAIDYNRKTFTAAFGNADADGMVRGTVQRLRELPDPGSVYYAMRRCARWIDLPSRYDADAIVDASMGLAGKAVDVVGPGTVFVARGVRYVVKKRCRPGSQRWVISTPAGEATATTTTIKSWLSANVSAEQAQAA